MSAITDWAAQEQADLTKIQGLLTSITTGIAALDQKILDLEKQLASSGTLSADDQAALDAVKAASDSLVTQAQGISTADPTPPPAS